MVKSLVLRDRFGIDALQLEDGPAPVPRAGEVLVQIGAAALNYRDLMMVRGQYDPSQPLPLVPGSDGCGVVSAVGPGVQRVSVGDRVLPTFHQAWTAGRYRPGIPRATLGGPLDGTLRQFGCFAEHGLVAAPASLDDAEAATLVCAGVTAWNALRASPTPCGPGDSVLVIGTGGVSSFAIQLAKAAGARVIAVTRSEAKAERARSLGVDHVVVEPSSPPTWGRAVRKATDDRGVDLVVETGGAGTLEQSLSAVRTGGTLAVLGVLAGRSGAVDLAPVLMRAIRLQGVFVGSRCDLEDLCRAVEGAAIRPLVDTRYPLEDGAAALTALGEGRHMGKIVVETATS